MANRPFRAAAITLLLVLPAISSAATFRTTNFIVDAPTEALARQFGEAAERFRKEKAVEWLGEEMPNWQQPCPLRVEITMEGPSGATTFDYAKRPIYQFMQIKGPKERLLNSVLPHEVTHTVFAYYFQQPVPRWADEGGSVLSEDDLERNRHDTMCRQLLNGGRAFTLKTLFSMTNYPSDVMVLYAEGFSIVRFLVDSSDRATFLQFVRHGMKAGWDSAAQQFYQFRNVNELEQAWIASLRKPRTNGVIASNVKPPSAARASGATLTGQSVVRSSNPPALPDLSHAAIHRGTANLNRPTQLPDVTPIAAPPPPLPQAPTPVHLLPHEPVRLGTPQLGPQPRR